MSFRVQICPLFLFLLLLLFVGPTSAAETYLGLGISARLERETESRDTVDAIVPYFFEAGVGEGKWRFMGELLYYNDKTSESFVEIELTHYEMNLLGKYHPWREVSSYLPIFGAGIGFIQENVETRIGGEVDRVEGDVEPVFIGSVGFLSTFSESNPIGFGLDIRALYSESFDPEVEFDIGGRINFIF